jgi:hypothetical protein
MSVVQHTIKQVLLSAGFDNPFPKFRFTPLRPLRQRLEQIDITCPHLAHRLCHLIPAQCPFARTLRWGDRILISIPPLCKLNPFYEELMMLRFRALCYLAEECGEDISQYC